MSCSQARRATSLLLAWRIFVIDFRLLKQKAQTHPLDETALLDLHSSLFAWMIDALSIVIQERQEHLRLCIGESTLLCLDIALVVNSVNVGSYTLWVKMISFSFKKSLFVLRMGTLFLG